jgi:hypothetical protein
LPTAFDFVGKAQPVGGGLPVWRYVMSARCCHRCNDRSIYGAAALFFLRVFCGSENLFQMCFVEYGIISSDIHLFLGDAFCFVA